jgi:hypothetical protein
MARHILAGPEAASPGRASYQVGVFTCAQCQRGFQDAAGERVEVSPEIVNMPACDAQCIGSVDALTHVGQPATELEPALTLALLVSDEPSASSSPRASQTIPPALRRKVLRRDGHCVVPGCKQPQRTGNAGRPLERRGEKQAARCPKQ